jgi:hypothetical protein
MRTEPSGSEHAHVRLGVLFKVQSGSPLGLGDAKLRRQKRCAFKDLQNKSQLLCWCLCLPVPGRNGRLTTFFSMLCSSSFSGCTACILLIAFLSNFFSCPSMSASVVEANVESRYLAPLLNSKYSLSIYGTAEHENW